jgi:hypothetical protein
LGLILDAAHVDGGRLEVRTSTIVLDLSITQDYAGMGTVAESSLGL